VGSVRLQPAVAVAAVVAVTAVMTETPSVDLHQPPNEDLVQQNIHSLTRPFVTGFLLKID
jgi:hypothetical protein